MKELMEFYPKLLLLGEYSILLGGHAITVPLRIYRASFDFLTHANRNPDAINSNTTLLNLANYFMHHEVISHNINIIRFLEDLENGLYLKSTIPMGYGIGSSGVVCAAILKTYPTDSLKPDFSPHGTYRLKTLLGAMESFFHGTSSGLDPLACYRDRPLLILGNEINELQYMQSGINHWFLLDSSSVRNSRPLIESFLQHMTDPVYKHTIQNDYIPLVDEIAEKIAETNKNPQNINEIFLNEFLNLWKKLSIAQSQYFMEMIPQNIRSIWQSGITSGLYYLKLLGAGGGGFFLGCTQHKTITGKLLTNNGYHVVWLTL